MDRDAAFCPHQRYGVDGLKRFAYFAIAGGTAALVNFGSRIALSEKFSYWVAIVIAYMFGMITAFLLNRIFVFPEGNEGIHRQAAWFIAINLLALTQTVATSLLLARWLFPAVGWIWHPEALAHAVGVSAPILSSYYGHKRFTFRRRMT